MNFNMQYNFRFLLCIILFSLASRLSISKYRGNLRSWILGYWRLSTIRVNTWVFLYWTCINARSPIIWLGPLARFNFLFTTGWFSFGNFSSCYFARLWSHKPQNFYASGSMAWRGCLCTRHSLPSNFFRLTFFFNKFNF